ncbi:MAG: glycosyltransferase family 39 protein [Chloroflexota bacterium]|nr:glycosyltransferase family 39 protein [Chloroflexota bacterium]
MLLLALASAMVLAAAAATTTLLDPEGRLDATITVGVLAAAEIALLIGVTGVAGWLEPGVVIAADAAWAALAAALVVRRGKAASTATWRTLAPPSPRAALAAMRTHPWATVVVGLAVVALAWQALVALVLPPFAYDALTYHLTTAATWVQRGDLDPVNLSLCCSTYPLNGELFFAWPMLLEGSDAVVGTVQIGFALLASLAVAGLARSAGLCTAAATAAAALFAVTPIVLTQSPTGYVDVMVAAWALAALHFLVRFGATRDLRRLLPAGLATGLLLGTKGTGIVWAAVLTAAAMALVASSIKADRLVRRRALGGAGTFLGACLALGGYWYARNWVIIGNPLHPFLVNMGGVTVFDGPIRVEEVLTTPPAGADQAWPLAVIRSWAADMAFWHHGSYDYQERRGGLGPLWPWLGLPLLLPLALRAVRWRTPLLLPLVVAAAVFAVQPYRWWSRFTIPLAGLGALAIVTAAWSSRPWLSRLVRASALSLALIGVLLSSYQVDPAARARPLRAAALLRLIGSPSGERTVGRIFYPEYRFVEEVPEGSTVVVDLRAEAVRFVYPLFGSSLTRRVIPSDDGPLPPDAWVVTAEGRSLDARLQRDARYVLASNVQGVRAWRPLLG